MFFLFVLEYWKKRFSLISNEIYNIQKEQEANQY